MASPCSQRFPQIVGGIFLQSSNNSFEIPDSMLLDHVTHLYIYIFFSPDSLFTVCRKKNCFYQNILDSTSFKPKLQDKSLSNSISCVSQFISAQTYIFACFTPFQINLLRSLDSAEQPDNLIFGRFPRVPQRGQADITLVGVQVLEN